MKTRGFRSVLVLVVAVTATLALSGSGHATSQVDYAIALSVDGAGTVTGPGINCRESGGDCSKLYTQGTVVTLTATPDSGATFIDWGGDCSGTATTCTVTMDSNKGILANFSPGSGNPTLAVSVTGNGTVTGNGINCGSGNTDCSETYASGTSVTLTETPGSGASFSGWGGSCSGTSTQCTVVMNASKSVGASFTGGSTSTLTVGVTGSGRVTGSGIDCGAGFTDCSETYATNSSVTLTTTPSSGATFTGWGGSCTGTATTCTVVMNTSKSVTATFTTAPTTATLSVTVTGNGRVTGPGISCGTGATDCSETYTTNTSVTLTASPNAGALFAGWSGSCSGTSATCTVVMSTARTVGAAFATDASTRTLTVSTGGSGRVVASGINCGGNFNDCSESYPNGSRITLTAVPASGAVFLGWGGACAGTATTCNVLLDENRAVSASFGARRIDNGGTGAFSAVSLGNPLVVRTSVGWAVTLRFHVNQAAAALLRLSRGGRLLNAFTFSPRRGDVLVGPFHLGSTGAYRFVLNLSNGRGASTQLIWNLCLSSSPCNSFRPTVGFVRRGSVTFGRTASGWLVRARFTATRAGVGTAQMFVGGRRVSVGTFTFNRGQVLIDLPTTRRGTHRIVLNARDSAGRRVTLSWVVTVR